MSSPHSVERDERTVAVENASYRWGFILLAYALLIDIACRAVILNEAAWDLMGLVIVSSGVCTLYQVRHKTLPQGWAKHALLLALFAGLIAAIIAVVFAVGQIM